jgi:hypothetical protein
VLLLVFLFFSHDKVTVHIAKAQPTSPGAKEKTFISLNAAGLHIFQRLTTWPILKMMWKENYWKKSLTKDEYTFQSPSLR